MQVAASLAPVVACAVLVVVKELALVPLVGAMAEVRECAAQV